MAAAALGAKTDKPLVVVNSATNAFLMYANDYIFDVPGDGAFTDQSDRLRLFPVMEACNTPPAHVLGSFLFWLSCDI